MFVPKKEKKLLKGRYLQMSKVENNAVNSHVDPNIKLDLMRYRNNSLSYMLGLVALITSVVAAFIGLNSLAYNFTTLIKILMNIAILLFGFLFTEQSKTYSKNGSLCLMGLGCVSLLRILWAPRILLFGTAEQWGKVITNPANVNWLPADAQFRGILALILLLVAATAFLSAGLIGYIKASKLEKYMETIKGVK
jgi:hypothetical protein